MAKCPKCYSSNCHLYYPSTLRSSNYRSHPAYRPEGSGLGELLSWGISQVVQTMSTSKTYECDACGHVFKS